jgi:hypothetical protein
MLSRKLSGKSDADLEAELRGAQTSLRELEQSAAHFGFCEDWHGKLAELVADTQARLDGHFHSMHVFPAEVGSHEVAEPLKLSGIIASA